MFVSYSVCFTYLLEQDGQLVSNIFSIQFTLQGFFCSVSCCKATLKIMFVSSSVCKNYLLEKISQFMLCNFSIQFLYPFQWQKHYTNYVCLLFCLYSSLAKTLWTILYISLIQILYPRAFSVFFLEAKPLYKLCFVCYSVCIVHLLDQDGQFMVCIFP